MSLASVIIIHFRQDALTDEVLRSFDRHQAQSPAEVIVVDNASPSAYTLPTLKNPARVKNLRLEPGLGFGGACQAGIQAVSPETAAQPCIILNNDIVFEDDLVAGLLAALREHPQAGMIGPRVVFPDGRFQLSWGDDLTLRSELREKTRQREMHSGGGSLYSAREEESKRARPVDWLSGVAFIITREALQRIGGLGNSYFFYFEDCDWCRKVRQSGLQVWYDPRVTLKHLLGASSPKRDRSPKTMLFYRSRELGHLVYYSRFNSWLEFQALRALLTLKAIKNRDFGLALKFWQRFGRDAWKSGISVAAQPTEKTLLKSTE